MSPTFAANSDSLWCQPSRCLVLLRTNLRRCTFIDRRSDMLGILGYPKQQSGLCVVKPGEANKVMTGGRERTEVSYRLDLDFIRSSFDAVQSERICLMIPRN